MGEQVFDAENWKLEASAVIKDIGKHVRKLEIVDGTDQCIYFNLTTIEGNDFCIELSASGFRIVGTKHNCKDDNNEEYFETPYSLLHQISPQFHQSFSNELMNKLNELKDT